MFYTHCDGSRFFSLTGLMRHDEKVMSQGGFRDCGDESVCRMRSGAITVESPECETEWVMFHEAAPDVSVGIRFGGVCQESLNSAIRFLSDSLAERANLLMQQALDCERAARLLKNT